MCIIVLVPYKILTRCWLNLYVWTICAYIEKLRGDEGVPHVCARCHRHRGKARRGEVWHGVVDLAWPVMTRCGAGSGLVLPLKPVDDRSFGRYCSWWCDLWELNLESLFHFHLLPFPSSYLPHRKPWRLICSASERLLVFYGSGWDKRLIPASIQYSCANIPPHSFCCNQSSPRLGSCVHRNTESRPSKPSCLCVHLLRRRAMIRFLGSTPTTISYTSWGWL